MSEALTPIQQATRRPAPAPSNYMVRRASGNSQPESEVLGLLTERRRVAKQDRTKYEPDWSLALHYMAGKQWVGISQRTRRVMSVLNDPREENRVHHTENVLTSYVYTALGQLIDDDMSATLLFRDSDWKEVKYAEEANLAYRYAFDEELDGDEVIADTFLNTVALGTGLIRCRLVRGQGESYGQFPVGPDGQLVTGTGRHAYVADAQQAGQTLQYGELRGEMELEPLLPHNLLVPPGISNYRKFPWFFVEAPVHVDQLKREFPNRAGDIRAQNLQIVDIAGLAELSGTDGSNGPATAGKISDHALLTTYYEKPSSDFPEGRVVHFTGETMLEETPQLPYLVAGVRMAGVVPFRFRKVPGRFWGRSLIDDAIGVQHQRNRARSQHIEWKDRNLGRVYSVKGTITEANKPTGRIMENIEVLPGYNFPSETQPGTLPSVAEELGMLDDAMDRVTGISKVSALSQAPANVAAYAAFAFFKQQDEQRNKPIRVELYRAMRDLTKIILCGIRQYWPPEKLVTVTGDTQGDFKSFVFRKENLPTEVYVQVGKGASHPSDPAALVQLCFDVFDRGISSGHPLPLSWLLESLTAGKPAPLPDELNDVQRDKAEMENLLMEQGTVPPVALYDLDPVHIPIHRELEATASLDPSPEGQMLVMRIEQHLQQHEQSMQQKAATATNVPQAQGPLGALGGAPEQGPPPGSGGPMQAAAANPMQALLSRVGAQPGQ